MMPIFANLFDVSTGPVLAILTFKHQAPGKDLDIGPSIVMTLADLKEFARVMTEVVRKTEEALAQGQARQ